MACDRKIDQRLDLGERNVQRYASHFLHCKVEAVSRVKQAIDREDMISRGEAARGDRKIDQLLGMKRLEEDRDIVNLGREDALGMAAKDKADGMIQDQILPSK